MMTHISGERCIAIIPARGGSKGIPRKNARLLDGKPLLAHCIDNAFAASCFAAVYVSTDDPELREIATRFGASVLDRPPHLADDRATLDEVIHDAWAQLRERGVPCDYVATLQPTCPLLTATTIREAVGRCTGEDDDTVLTVVNETHLAWTRRGGQAVPLYLRRVNRQELPPYLRETGGVVVATAGQVATGTRFGDRVAVVEVSKAEAIDIDDFYDWWLAEKALTRRKVCFHVVGNREAGLGHVYRALTLAERLTDHEVTFLTTPDSQLAKDVIEARFHRVKLLSDRDALGGILAESPDVLVNDVLDTGADFMREVAAAGVTTVNFEDRGPGSVHADYLINAMYAEHPLKRSDRVYHGVEYCCLRDEFYSLQPGAIAADVGTVLVLFGGTDPWDYTRRTLAWLDRMPGDWAICVIAGPGYGHAALLERTAEQCRHPATVVRDTRIISKYMRDADIAVTGAGRTVFELAALGVPMIVMPQSEREEDHTFATTSLGVVHLGPAAWCSEQRFQQTVSELAGNRLLREKMQQALLASDIRCGVDRVLEIIEQAARRSRGAGTRTAARPHPTVRKAA